MNSPEEEWMDGNSRRWFSFVVVVLCQTTNAELIVAHHVVGLRLKIYRLFSLSLFISFLIRWTEKNNRLQFVQTEEEEEEEKKTRQRDREISLSKITLSSKTHHLVTLGDARLPTTGNCVDFNSFIVLFCSTTGFLVVFILGKTSIDRSLSNRFFFIVAIKMNRSPEAKRYIS